MERHALALGDPRDRCWHLGCILPKVPSVSCGQGEGNPPKCSALCTTDTGDCKQQPSYHPGTDFDYWIPLEFDEEGTVQQFKPFVDEFQLEL
eukprot:COSAG04_NODE_324_length_16823_cov_176.872937_2_plen_92_part_00